MRVLSYMLKRMMDKLFDKRSNGSIHFAPDSCYKGAFCHLLGSGAAPETGAQI